MTDANPLRQKLVRPFYWLPFFRRLGITWLSEDEWLQAAMSINPALRPLLTEDQKRRLSRLEQDEAA